MPSWPTVALTLGVAVISFIGGLSSSLFGLRGTRLTVVHEESEAWRKLLVEACQNLSDGWLVLRALLHEPVIGRAFDAEQQQQLRELSNRCAQTVARVILLVGRKSTTGLAADEVDSKVAALKDVALSAAFPWDAETKTEIELGIKLASEAHHKFQVTAQVAIEPDGWREQVERRFEKLRRQGAWADH